MVREYGPFRERFEGYILERTANHPSFEIWCDSRHPILQTASDLIEIERPLCTCDFNLEADVQVIRGTSSELP